MAKEKTDKKERKEKVHSKHGDDGVKKDRKEKRDKSVRKDKHGSAKSEAAALADSNLSLISTADSAIGAEAKIVTSAPRGGDAEVQMKQLHRAALVAFANPLAENRDQKKVLKTVKTAAKHKALKRGVKEVVKAIRKSPMGDPKTPASALPSGIVVLAADISPPDVISHIPVLCEDHNVPYVFLPSRAELGAAGNTKRPTSVVMLQTPKAGARAGGAKTKTKPGGDDDGAESGAKTGDAGKEGESEEAWSEAYADLNKLVIKLGQYIKV